MRRIKLSKRFNVMDWQTISNVSFAISAPTLLVANHDKARFFPSTPAICSWTTNPKRRLFSRFMLFPIFTSTLGRAKTWFAFAPLYFVAINIWLQSIFFAAVFTGKHHRWNIHRIVSTTHNRWMCILFGRPSNLIHSPSVLYAETCPRTKTLAPQETRNDADFFTTHFTFFCNTFDFVAHGKRIA